MKTIPNALDLAEQVAQIIVENAYHSTLGDKVFGVHDLLLYGSVARGEPAHDIDILVLHNLKGLRKLGIATVYNAENCRKVPDLMFKNAENRKYTALILEAMGCRDFTSIFDARNDLDDVLRKIRYQLRDEYDALVGVEEFRVDIDNHSLNEKQTWDLPYLGSTTAPVKDWGSFNGNDQLITLFEQRYKPKMVIEKVKKLLADGGLELEPSGSEEKHPLDLHAMDVSLLFSTPGADQLRQTIIQQCKDPTYWHTVLESGRLYDRETRKFEHPITSKYPQALELFKVDPANFVPSDTGIRGGTIIL